MPHRVTICSIAIAVLSVSGPAGAQTEADAIRARVKDGQKVSITTDAGDELNGRISDMTAGSLTIVTRRERATVPFPQIVKIDHPRDTLANGAKIGFGVGAALAVAALAAEDWGCDSAEAGFFGCPDPGAGGYAGFALVFGGIGAAVGLGIDALIRRDPAIYRRGSAPRLTVAPALGLRTRGAVLSVSW